MNIYTPQEAVVDPEVRAFVLSLVNALGGSSAGDDGRYVLGDDALAVLKDIKRWLRLYDDKTNRLDVARVLAEANFVTGDLLEILASWPHDAQEGSFRSKLSLLSVDLLTQLTWPIERDEEHTALHHFNHIPALRKAQLKYKQAILHHETCHTLHTAIRVALPALAKPNNERSVMEDNIIKVVLYLFRNLVLIAAPTTAENEEADHETDRSATIDAFHRQDVFQLLLMICSNLSESYQTHDVEILETVFHLVKGIDVDALFMEKQEILSESTKHLKDLLALEKGMFAGYNRNAPSRHSRFGTMVWMKKENSNLTLFGHRALASEQETLAQLDKSKQWKKPRRAFRKDPTEKADIQFDAKTPLTDSARKHLRSFVEQFLDSSFNPLFTALRRAIEREADRVQPQTHTQQYFYLISWFLRAEHARRNQQRAKQPELNQESFTLVASVLDQETFVLLNRNMQRALDEKNWQQVNAGMKCFAQVLSTVQEMSESALDEDQEIAENILSRIFYEQSTHDRIVLLLRSYKDQGFGYLDACTELSHVFLRLLERYSKQNVDLQIRSRRRARKKKAAVQAVDGGEEDEEDDRRLAAEDVSEAQRTSTERRFDFTKFAAKFVNQASVDTFVALLRYHRELNHEQLKRAHRFFYRVAFKMELAVYLFRLDIVHLLNKLVKGPDGMGLENPMYKEWQDLVQHVFRQLVKRMHDRPALGVELLFSKMPQTLFYLEHGFERELPKKTHRAPVELEVKGSMAVADQLGVAVSIMINQSKFDLLAWTKETLAAAVTERKAWEEEHGSWQLLQEAQKESEAHFDPILHDDPANDASEKSMPPPISVSANTADRRTALQKDKHLRLLLLLVGFVVTRSESADGEDTESWQLPADLSSAKLASQIDLINKFEYDPPVYEDGKSAEDLVRRKTLSAPARAVTRAPEADSEGESDIEQMFPAGGPTTREKSSGADDLRPKKKRSRLESTELLDERVLEERREARRMKEVEKRSRIKSTLYVNESDDETDEERDRKFFELEEKRRQHVRRGMKQTKFNATAFKEYKNGKKRKSMSDDEKEAEEDSNSESGSAPRKRHRRKHNGEQEEDSSMSEPESSDVNDTVARDKAILDSTPLDSEADTDTENTPVASQHSTQNASQRLSFALEKDPAPTSRASSPGDAESDKENSGGGAPTAAPKRRTVKAGLVIDSDSE